MYINIHSYSAMQNACNKFLAQYKDPRTYLRMILRNGTSGTIEVMYYEKKIQFHTIQYKCAWHNTMPL